MRLFGITRTGLTAMTMSVCALWGCIMMETVARHNGERDAAIVRQRLERLRHEAVPVPVSTPAPWRGAVHPVAS